MNQALLLLSSRDETYQFRTGAEVNKVSLCELCGPSLLSEAVCANDQMSLLTLQLMDAVMLQLTRARNRLTTPASLTLPELATSGLMVGAGSSTPSLSA